MIDELEASASNARLPGSKPDTDALIDIPPSPTCAACVVIPARDEADSIARALESLASQRGLDGRPFDAATFEVIVLANNCRDQTGEVARAWARRVPSSTLHVVEIELPPEAAHVGYARRLAMDEACRRLFVVGRPRGVIATTDADTVVSPTWLATTLQEVAHGAEAVGGRILIIPEELRSLAPAVRARFLRNVGYWALVTEVAARIDPRPGDPWPCHEQFSGANLAVTARSYRTVGGLPPLPSSEDVALGKALGGADIEIRHSPAVRVHTSGRLAGRAPAGMADLLASWSDLPLDGPFQRVPSAETAMAQATGRRALRDLWRHARASREVCAAEVARLAEFAGAPEAWLYHALLDAERFGGLLDDFEKRARWRRAPVLADVRTVIQDLRAWLEPYRRPGARPPAFSRHVAGLPFVPPVCRPVCLAVQPQPEDASAPLEQIQPIAEIVPALASPPHVA